MKIKLTNGTEYGIEQFIVSNILGEEENGSTMVTFHLGNQLRSSEFFETLEQDFTEENTTEIVLYCKDTEIKFSPKSAITKTYSSNAFGNQTTISFKN